MIRPYIQQRMDGFTLLEILIAMGIGSSILVLATYFAIDITNFGLFLGERLETQRPLEQTMRVFLRETRSMTDSENGSYPIADAQAASFTFHTDVDADGVIEQVRYFLNGTELQKGIIEPAGTPAMYDPADEDVRTVVEYVVPGTEIFSYWTEGWIDEMASLSFPVTISDIRLVRLQMTVDKDPMQVPSAVIQRVNVTIRNLRGEI